MAALRIKLPPQQRQTVYNLRRWNELLADRELARIEGRVETDRHGRVILNPTPPPLHGSYQARIGHVIKDRIPNGRVITVCPISTADGVKAADVAWASPECMRNLGNRECFAHAPEICVEVVSPSNTQTEIDEKMILYFDAGAQEVWICSRSGVMKFFERSTRRQLKASRLCPAFPKQVKLP